ncbi:retrovirus-related pol polyprotein from transposon TNT 1-94 [Tanacetum coccineum]
MSKIGMSMLASKGNVPDVWKSKFIQNAMALHLLHQYEDPATMILLSKTAAGVAIVVPETPLQFGVAEILSRTFRAKSTGIRAQAPKMLWAYSVSTTYLIYRIPYILIGLRIPEEEWRGKDTSLVHLKVFGCDSFVTVKDVCGKVMKCTFISNGLDEVRYSFWDTKSHPIIRSRDITFVDSIYGARSATDSSSLTKPIQKSQVVLVDIPENLAENESIVSKHGLSSEITQSPGRGSDTSEGSENSRSFEDSGRSDKEYSKDGASSKEGGFKTPQVRRSTRESRDPGRIPAGKKALQRLWMFKVKEEQNGRKRYKARLVVKGFQQKQGEPSFVGSLNDTFTQHKSEGFQLAGQKENLKCRLKGIMYGLLQAPRLWYLKFDSFMQKDKPCKDVHQVGDEREVELLRNFNWPLSELITEDGVLPEREREDTLYRKSPSPAFGWSSVFRMFGGTERFNDSSGRADHAVQLEWDRWSSDSRTCCISTGRAVGTIVQFSTGRAV